jgi:hypothetical protein
MATKSVSSSSIGDGEAYSSAGGGTDAVATTAREDDDDEVPAASERRVSRRTLRPCCVACVMLST